MHPNPPSRLRLARPVVATAFVLLAACDHPPPLEYRIDPAALELELQEAIADFECGYTTFAWIAMGHEDALASLAGVSQTTHVYRADAATGECETESFAPTWFDPIMGARAQISNAAETGLYDLMRAEPPGPEIERLAAIAAIYMAAALAHFGEFYCEVTFDGGDLRTPDAVLEEAEAWLTDRALVHVASRGDFALPGGVATSARTTALALRARIRWARGDLAGAASDAAEVPYGFAAWITREDSPTRRNKVYYAGRTAASPMLRMNDWWSGAANPATGAPWASPIPFTGYLFLGVGPDGRAVDDLGRPVLWAEEMRDHNLDVIPRGGGIVADPRVPHEFVGISGAEVPERPTKYTSAADDIPLVSWREMWLILAEAEGGQVAIDRIDDLRAAASLPPVTYVDGATASPEQIRFMILEERRRELFGEGGRHWASKLHNLDVAWFPRGEGTTPFAGYPYRGGVRLAMPEEEYLTNPHLLARGGLAARGTGCDPLEAPVFP